MGSSIPVFVDCTTIVLPATGPEVNSRLKVTLIAKAERLRCSVGLRVAGTAPCLLAATADGGGSKSIGEVVVHGPGLVVVACECHAVRVTAAPVARRKRVVVPVACCHWLADVCFLVPGAGGLAAVPVPVGSATLMPALEARRVWTYLVVWPEPEV